LPKIITKELAYEVFIRSQKARYQQSLNYNTVIKLTELYEDQ